ncbi:hypothetical protein K502DRAFT_169011 [Neoconidiobolus thromboides FSU 785]|nr:hypothetical protein K502DRAFT_169011 [Neoconidiobolus thromboides FSU 785]
MVETNENIVFSLPNVLKKSDKLKLLPKFLEKEFNFIGEASLLLRNSSLKLINLINEMDAKKQQLPIILDGMSGSGKSSHLLQLVSYSLIKKNWVVIYIPNAINWVNGTSSYNPDIEKDLYQQPQLTNEFLKQIQYLNKDNLDKIVLENDVTFNQVKFSKGTKLNQIILNGINDLAVSTDCMKLLFDVLEKQKEFPVLLAIDEINNFYGTTAYFNKNSEPIQATQLSFINQLNQFISGKKKFNQGLIIGANSTIDLKYSSNEFNNKNNKEEIKYNEFLSRVSENKKIQYQQFNINNFNLKEAESIYKYYNEAHLIFKDFSLKELNRKFLLSNGNPKQFFKSTVCTV